MTDRQVCTKEAPMPPQSSGLWCHPDAVTQPTQSDNYQRYHCPNCGLHFKVELPQ